MGYPRDLDEMEELALVRELERRKVLRDAGRCDYCERLRGTEPSCKFPARHRARPLAARRVAG